MKTFGLAILGTLALAAPAHAPPPPKAQAAWQRNGCSHGHQRKPAKRGVRAVMRSPAPLTRRRGARGWHFVRCVPTRRLERDMRHYLVKYRGWRKRHICGQGGTARQNVRLGRCEAAKRGWRGGQWSCLYTLWNHESGWVTTKANYAGSGAYGIPQALPGSKMGPGWQTNPVVQVRWGLGYIAGRYGSPCGAWGHWQGAGSY